MNGRYFLTYLCVLHVICEKSNFGNQILTADLNFMELFVAEYDCKYKIPDLQFSHLVISALIRAQTSLFPSYPVPDIRS